MASEPSPYRGFPVNPSARPALRRAKQPDIGVSSGANDKALQRDRHVWAPQTNRGTRPYCRRCGQPAFVVEGAPCAGKKA